MEKHIENGEVAVLFSPGYGAGWYSWNTKFPECIFHPDIVALVKKMQECNIEEEIELIKQIEEKAKEMFGKDFYVGGAEGLTIEWIKEGQIFRITEYDGYERIEYCGVQDYIIA